MRHHAQVIHLNGSLQILPILRSSGQLHPFGALYDDTTASDQSPTPSPSPDLDVKHQTRRRNHERSTEDADPPAADTDEAETILHFCLQCKCRALEVAAIFSPYFFLKRLTLGHFSHLFHEHSSAVQDSLRRESFSARGMANSRPLTSSRASEVKDEETR